MLRVTGQPDRKPVRCRLPKLLNVAGSIWRVEIREPWSEGEVGACQPRERAIWISKALSGHCILETFIHEVIHAMLYSVGFQDSPAAEHEELVVSMLSQILLDTFTRNGFKF